jgi:hypothetical protein
MNHLRIKGLHSKSQVVKVSAGMIIVATLFAACIPLRGGYALNSKIVTAKSGTHLLVADDGTYCSVSEKQFNEVAVGDAKWCAWGPADGSSAPGRTTGVGDGRRPPITSKPPR